MTTTPMSIIVGGVGFREDEGVIPVGVVGGGTVVEGGVFFLSAMEGCNKNVLRLLSWG